jgi:hypothetical protein
MNDIANFKAIFSIYENLTSYSVESITELILALEHVKFYSFTSDDAKVLFFIFLFLKPDIIKNNTMTNISVNIVNKINNYKICKNQNKVAFDASDDLVEINLLLNNYFIEFDKFISQYNIDYYDKLTQIVYNLHKLKESVTKIDNCDKLYNYLDRISKSIVDTLYKLDHPHILKKKINQLILTNDIDSNLSSITDLLTSPLFTDIYKNIELHPENSINEILYQFYELHDKHMKKPILKIIFDIDDLTNNNDKLLNVLYKVCSGYENVIFKYFTNISRSNFLYKYMLEILYNPVLFPEYKISDDKIIIFSFSIIFFIHNYFFSDESII